ncbi:MAG: hypothetical protein QXK51_01180 [Candidatus Methanomethylicia archaeon]
MTHEASDFFTLISNLTHKQYEIVPCIVKVVTNLDKYINSFQLGELLNIAKIYETNANVVKVYFLALRNISRIIEKYFKLRHVYGGTVFTMMDGVHGIYKVFNTRLFKMETALIDLENTPVLIVNSFYHRFIKHGLGSWMPTGRRLTNVIHAKMLLTDLSLIHGAAIEYSNSKSLVFIAGSNVGKSSLVFNIALENGLGVYAEDMFATDGRYIYPCPYTTTYLRNIEILRKLRGSILSAYKYLILRLIGHLNPIDLMWSYMLSIAEEDLTNISRKIFRQTPSEADMVVFLEKAKNNQLTTIDDRHAINRVLFNNRLEFDYYRDILISVYSIVNENINVEMLLRKEEEVVDRLIRNAKDLFLIQFNNFEELYKLIQKIIT